MSDEPSKQERYFTGMPIEQDPSKPLPGEVDPGMKTKFIMIGVAIGLFSLGIVLGLFVSPETPAEAEERIVELEIDLDRARERIASLNRALTYQGTADANSKGLLKNADRRRHQRDGKRYAAALRKAKAQSAAELIEWFVARWNSLLDKPQDGDRIQRRAQVLAQLIGGMALNLDPDDYVPWQAEFLNGKWLGDLHFDMDGDGFPAKRTADNPKDGFADVSICLVAMALNQAVLDAQVLVQPRMRCDSPNAKISVFLQGRTLDGALDEFVRAVRREGFFVNDRIFKGTRLILIGPRARRK